MDAERFVVDRVRRMSAYAPITPVETIARRIGAPLNDIVKLDANENPYGPSPRALEAIAHLSDAHRYPDPDQSRLRAAIAGFTGLPADNLICGAGADELHLALEAGKVLGAPAVLAQQLDGGGAAQHGVAGPIDGAHAALAEA